MKQVRGIWLPSAEQHLLAYAQEDDWGYQEDKLDLALKWVKKFDVALDVGAHCGLWSRRMARVFKKIYAFEPIALHRQLYELNVEGDYELFPVACGDKATTVKMKTVPHSTGDTNIDKDGTIDVSVVRIDDMIDTPCDFMKIDTEGYEELVLRGASKLLESKPCVIVEQKPNKAQKYGLMETGAVTFLRTLGAKVREVTAGDYIMSWDG